MDPAAGSSVEESTAGSLKTSGETKLAKSCVRCRRHKLACKAGAQGRYPCSKCEQIESGYFSAQCILVERARVAPGPTLSERLAKQEKTTTSLEQLVAGVQRDVKTLVELFRSRSVNTSPEAIVNSTGSGHQTIALPQVNGLENINTGSTLNEHSLVSKSHSAVSISGSELPLASLVDVDEVDITTSRPVNDARRYRAPLEPEEAPSLKRKRRLGTPPDTAEYMSAFESFVTKNLPALCFFDPKGFFQSPTEIKARSELLFSAIIAVGSRERPDLHDIHVSALSETMRLLGESVCGRQFSIWDLCGTMVYNRYLAPITPIGQLVDLAYSLDLDSTYETMRQRGSETTDDARKIRLWICILGQDIFQSHSGVCNRPPHYPHRAYALSQARWLASSQFALPNDQRLLATYEFETIIHSVLIDERPGDLDTLSGFDWQQITRQKCAEMDEWYTRWEPVARAQSSPTEMSSMLSTLKVNSNLAKFTINTRPLRGVRKALDLNVSNEDFVSESVRWARALCRLCVTDFQAPAICFVGETTLFAFAWCANFIMKVTTSLQVMSDIEAILTEIEQLIANLRFVQHSTYAEMLQTTLDYVRLFVAIGSQYPEDSDPLEIFGFSTTNGPMDMPSMDTTLGSLQSILSDPPRWDPSMTWWLPMAQGSDDWPWSHNLDPS